MSKQIAMSTTNKKLDERNLKILRDLAALPFNKQCFDCHQRGPTYINTTVGSFVCTSCSGRLRGLNPPHRVKSISMATFSAEELELVRCRGNEYCRKVWMGRHDKSKASIDETSFKDETQMKDFLTLKYEKKRWYVPPNEVQHSPVTSTGTTSNQSTSSQSVQSFGNQLVGQKTGDSVSSVGRPHPSGQNNGQATVAAFHGISQHQQPTISRPSLATNAQFSSESPKILQNLQKETLVDFQSDPFGSPLKIQSAASFQKQTFLLADGLEPPNFANFDAFQNGLAGSTSSQHGPTLPKSVTLPAMPSNVGLILPTLTLGGGAAVQLSSPGRSNGASDKYSALKELDELFSGGGVSSTSTSVSSAPRSPHVDVGVRSSTASSGVQWTASTGFGGPTAANSVPAGNPFFSSPAGAASQTFQQQRAPLSPYNVGANQAAPWASLDSAHNPFFTPRHHMVNSFPAQQHQLLKQQQQHMQYRSPLDLGASTMAFPRAGVSAWQPQPAPGNSSVGLPSNPFTASLNSGAGQKTWNPFMN